MSEACGLDRDLLSCPYRQTVNYLIAPPYTCPTCNGGFADGETLQMIQGPWGCNQLLRNHYGGDLSIGNTWAGSIPVPEFYTGSPICGGGFYGGDTRVAGPYTGAALSYRRPVATLGHFRDQGVICNEPNVGARYDDYYYGCRDNSRGHYGGMGYGTRKGQRKHNYQYKYRRSTRDGQGCVVM